MSNSSHYLKGLDYSVLQQCMHCGMCLPTCPTYSATLDERSSPRGRIAMMRAIADGRLDVSEAFGREMYFCLGCLACESACPAGVNYTQLFEMARAETERSRVLANPVRQLIRDTLIRGLFTRQWLLRLVGRFLWLYQVLGLQTLVRSWGLLRLAPKKLRELEPLTPTIQAKFSPQLIRETERPRDGKARYRVGVITGCVQDLIFSNVNRDTVDVLLNNGCEVFTPHDQGCCGSLHGHNGEWEVAKTLARRFIDRFQPEKLDFIVINAAGCGSHLKHYAHLLHDDPAYYERAKEWDRKIRDIHELLAEIGFRRPACASREQVVTYHEACHLVHGQKITRQPREVILSVPGLRLVELPESTWCCGSAGVYNITQPEMSGKLLDRKLRHVRATGVTTLVTSNPGCTVQLVSGLRQRGLAIEVIHPVSLLAQAYRRE